MWSLNSWPPLQEILFFSFGIFKVSSRHACNPSTLEAEEAHREFEASLHLSQNTKSEGKKKKHHHFGEAEVAELQLCNFEPLKWENSLVYTYTRLSVWREKIFFPFNSKPLSFSKVWTNLWPCYTAK